MKHLYNFVFEKLKLSKESKGIYKYFPKTKEELQDIIKAHLDEQGNSADLNDIDVSAITDMKGLFTGKNDPKTGNTIYLLTCIEKIKIDKWNVSNVTTMECMFEGCLKFNGDVSGWNVGNVETFEQMFDMCKEFTGDVSEWDVSHGEKFNAMFSGCSKFNCDISNWDVSHAYTLRCMFGDCDKFNQNLEKWDVSNVKDFDYTFSKCKSLSKNNRPSWATWKSYM